MCSVSYAANEYSIYHCCIIVKDFFISFSRVIIVQDFETVTFYVLFVYKPTFSVRLQLHVAIYRPDSFVLMLCYCANLKAIRYESTSLNRIVADKSHSVIVALFSVELNGYAFQESSIVFPSYTFL